MGMSGISKSQVSRLCAEIDEKVKAFLARPIEGDWPYLWIDATYVKVRQNGRIVSVAVIVAVGVNHDGRPRSWAYNRCLDALMCVRGHQLAAGWHLGPDHESSGRRSRCRTADGRH